MTTKYEPKFVGAERNVSWAGIRDRVMVDMIEVGGMLDWGTLTGDDREDFLDRAADRLWVAYLKTHDLWQDWECWAGDLEVAYRCHMAAKEWRVGDVVRYWDAANDETFVVIEVEEHFDVAYGLSSFEYTVRSTVGPRYRVETLLSSSIVDSGPDGEFPAGWHKVVTS